LAELIDGWSPQLNDPAARSVTWLLIAPHHDRIKDWLDDDVTVATIAQRLRDDYGADDYGADASQPSVQRWIATRFAEDTAGAGHRPTWPPLVRQSIPGRHLRKW
jgi:hypothetical protein